MKVKVRYFTFLREYTGKREEVIDLDEGASVDDLLNTLSSKYGKRFRDYVYGVGEFDGLTLNFLLNGKSIWVEEGLKSELKDGDVLSILPPVGGG